MTETNEQAEKVTIGSVGALWPARYDAGNDRIKGFYDKVVNTGKEFNEVLRLIQPMQLQHKPTRITLRMIVSDPNIGAGQEASIPLDGRKRVVRPEVNRFPEPGRERSVQAWRDIPDSGLPKSISSFGTVAGLR